MIKDFDKQQLVSNIVEYAHQREGYIIAEGIETKEELLKVLELGWIIYKVITYLILNQTLKKFLMNLLKQLKIIGRKDDEKSSFLCYNC